MQRSLGGLAAAVPRDGDEVGARRKRREVRRGRGARVLRGEQRRRRRERGKRERRRLPGVRGRRARPARAGAGPNVPRPPPTRRGAARPRRRGRRSSRAPTAPCKLSMRAAGRAGRGRAGAPRVVGGGESGHLGAHALPQPLLAPAPQQIHLCRPARVGSRRRRAVPRCEGALRGRRVNIAGGATSEYTSRAASASAAA